MALSSEKKLELVSERLSDPDLPPVTRLRICNALVKAGYVELAMPSLEILLEDPKYGGRARLLKRAATFLQRRGFVNRDVKSAQEGTRRAMRDMKIEDPHSAYWRSPDPEKAARSLMIVFTGANRQFWISLDILHRILHRNTGQILYLKDYRSIFYLGGVGKWGGYDGTLQRLRETVAEASVRKVYAMGTSAGGFAAMRYGVDLGVDSILAMSPRTSLRHLPEYPKVARRLKYFQIPEESLDLQPIYSQAGKRPETLIVYASGNERDVEQARRMEAFSEVTLRSVEGTDVHNIMTHLLATGRFEKVLTKFLST